MLSDRQSVPMKMTSQTREGPTKSGVAGAAAVVDSSAAMLRGPVHRPGRVEVDVGGAVALARDRAGWL